MVVTIIIDEIKEVVDNIPYIAAYTFPGYCFSSFVSFILGKPKSESKYRYIACIIISYVFSKLLLLFGEITKIKYISQDECPLWFLIIELIIALVAGYFVGLGLRSNWFNSILGNSRIRRTLNKNFWVDSLNEGVMYRVYMKNAKVYYEGQIVTMEENTHSPYFELSDFRVVNVESNKEIENFNHFHKNCQQVKGEKRTVIIGMDSVDHIVAVDTRNIK